MTNKGPNHSAHSITSKTTKISFKITFANTSNGFVVTSNLEHRKSLTSRMKFKRNYISMVKWVKDMTDQTWLSRILGNYTQSENDKLPTLKDSKPNQMNLKWLKTWNIASMVCILNIPKVGNHETFPNTIYSKTNWTIVHCLTLRQNYGIGKCSKWDFTKWLKMTTEHYGTHAYIKWKVLSHWNTT